MSLDDLLGYPVAKYVYRKPMLVEEENNAKRDYLQLIDRLSSNPFTQLQSRALVNVRNAWRTGGRASIEDEGLAKTTLDYERCHVGFSPGASLNPPPPPGFS